jgi:AcrR family transcriptional regulator
MSVRVPTPAVRLRALRGVATGARGTGRQADTARAKKREDERAAPAPDRRSRILGAAGQLFAARPYDEVSIDDIAGRAEVAKGLLYYYFGSKRGLFQELMREVVEGLNRIARAAPGVDPIVRLRQTLDAYLTLAAAAPEAFWQVSSGQLGPEVQAMRNREKAELIAEISEAVSGEREPRPVLRAALDGWISMVEGTTLHWCREGGLERSEVRALLLAALPGVLAAAQALDPSLTIDTRPVSERTNA